MHDKTNIYTYMAFHVKNVFTAGWNRAIQMIELFLRNTVSLCEKTAYDILFTFDKPGILMHFSCYHMPYVFSNVQIGALRRPMQGENVIFIQVLPHDL